MSEKYILYFDLINSRQISNRAAVKKQLLTTIKHINSNRKRELFRPLVQVKGIDELELILNTKQSIINILYDFTYLIHPYKYRIALTSGAIDILGKNANELDGQAFHDIVPILEWMKSNDSLFSANLPSDIAFQMLSNTAIDLLCRYWQDLTPIQFYIYNGLRNGIAQKQLALELATSQQNVSKTAQNIKAQKYIYIESIIHDYLSKVVQ